MNRSYKNRIALTPDGAIVACHESEMYVTIGVRVKITCDVRANPGSNLEWQYGEMRETIENYQVGSNLRTVEEVGRLYLVYCSYAFSFDKKTRSLLFVCVWRGARQLSGRMPDSQSSEPGFESPFATVSKTCSFSLLTPLFTQLYKWVPGYRQWWTCEWFI